MPGRQRTYGHQVGDVLGGPLSGGEHAKGDAQRVGGGACRRNGFRGGGR